MWPCIGTKIVSRSKKLLRDILSLARSDKRGIATGFYDKRWGRSRRMGLGPNS